MRGPRNFRFLGARRDRTALACLSIAIAMSMNGCGYIPFASEARERGYHVSRRDEPASKDVIQNSLQWMTCYELSDWAQAVSYYLRAGEKAPALAHLDSAVLTSDLSRIQQAMAARDCPSRRQMLAAGTRPPEQGSTLKFAYVCWQPAGGLTPMVKEGAGAAGPGCFTVKAEVSPGALAFFEIVPPFERRHEINRSDPPLLGSLSYGQVQILVRGFRAAFPTTAADVQTDGWINTGMGRLRFLTDDGKPLSPEQASAIERTIIRWVEEP